jgi:predicted RNA-binding protein with PIN domain
MKTYMIDGNNLIGKIKFLNQLQLKDKQSSREKLVFIVDNFFTSKNIKVLLFFDGYENLSIPSSRSKIIYSRNKTADDLIKKQIENSKNPRNVILVSSDNNLVQFARVCGCSIFTSEKFAGEISISKNQDEEKEREKSINNDEIKKLFDV